jgi:hypothetical protein
MALPYYLLMKLFLHVGPKQLEQFVTYNLLPKVILDYEAREGEKLTNLMKIDLHDANCTKEPTHMANEGAPMLMTVLDNSKLKPLKPKRTKTRPITNRLRKVCGQFTHQF